jgi:hypothetical protein
VDHKEQRHEHHRKERELEKKHHTAEGGKPKSLLPFHPAWLVALGVILTAAAVLVWTFLIW